MTNSSNSKEKNENSGNKITLIVLTISINYFIGSLFDSFTPILYNFTDMNSALRRYYTVVGNTILFFSHGISFFIFLLMDKSFTAKFVLLLKKCVEFKKK